MTKMTRECHFDKSDFFSREVQPLLDVLYEKCQQQNMPMLCVVQYAAGDDGDDMYGAQVATNGQGEQLVISPSVFAAMATLKAANAAVDNPLIADELLSNNPLIAVAMMHSLEGEEKSPLLKKATLTA